MKSESHDNMKEMIEPQTFALDYDDTFTAAPELWAMFVTRAKELGHRVFIVTCRRDSEEDREEIKMMLGMHGITLPIIFSNMGSKMWTVEQRGLKIDQWIDDAPYSIIHGR